MELAGEKLIAAAPEQVYAALNDPDILQQAVPGCETLEKVSDTELKATVKLKIGPISASFAGKVTLSDLNPPHGYTIAGEGSSGSAGFAKGSASVALAEHEAGTRLTYSAKAEVAGKMAQLGSRLIDATAKNLAEKFFTKFQEIVGKPPEAEAAEPAAAHAAAPAGNRKILIAAAAAVVLAAVLWALLG